MNDLTTRVKGYLVELAEEEWQTKFLSRLANKKKPVRSTAEAQKIYTALVEEKRREAERREAALAQAQAQAEEEVREMQEREIRERRVREILDHLVCGDARQAVWQAPYGIKLVLTDPPYGKNYQSHRRKVAELAPVLLNDDEEAVVLLGEVLTALYPRMAVDSAVFCFVDGEHEPGFREAIRNAGFILKGFYVWNKANHGSGDLEGTFAPKHERIIHAVKGNPKINSRPDDVLEGTEFLEAEHPTKKPLDLLRTIIEATTEEGDLVVDPFAGVGSTPLSAWMTKRDFWACELEEVYYAAMTDRLYQEIERKWKHGSSTVGEREAVDGSCNAAGDGDYSEEHRANPGCL